MSDITVKKALTADELAEMGVYLWPIWSKEESRFPWTYERTEACFILEGEVSVTTASGETVRIVAGDFVTFAKNLSCTWQVHKPIRKHYHFYD